MIITIPPDGRAVTILNGPDGTVITVRAANCPDGSAALQIAGSEPHPQARRQPRFTPIGIRGVLACLALFAGIFGGTVIWLTHTSRVGTPTTTPPHPSGYDLPQDLPFAVAHPPAHPTVPTAAGSPSPPNAAFGLD